MCPNCGKPVSDKALVCPHCSSSLLDAGTGARSSSSHGGFPDREVPPTPRPLPDDRPAGGQSEVSHGGWVGSPPPVEPAPFGPDPQSGAAHGAPYQTPPKPGNAPWAQGGWNVDRDAISQHVKTARTDALAALGILFRNPVGGIDDAYQQLDDQRAIGVGVAFALLFDVFLLIGVLIGLERMSSIPGVNYLAMMSGSDFGAGSSIKLLILGLTPFVSLLAAVSSARLVFRGSGRPAGDVFTAGTALLPFGLFFALAAVVGGFVPEILIVLLVFAIVYTILILYRGCTTIAGIGEGAAAAAVAIMLMFAGWLTSVLIRILL